MIVLIDNGHGVKTPGKCSPDKRLLEYKYCRELAKDVMHFLRTLNIPAHLVTPEDADVSLRERCNRVNAYCDTAGAKNVLLVSIHNNAAPPDDGQWHQARGWEAWTSPGKTGGDLLAECLYDAAVAALPRGTKIRTDLADGDRDKEARFAILTGTRCPACLTENLFQDNREDVAFLLSEEGRRAIAELHIKGILEYIKRYGK